MFIVQVHFPCKNYTMNVYNQYLELLENILSLYNDQGLTVVLGDFNTELLSQRNPVAPVIEYNGPLLNAFALKYYLCAIHTLDWCQVSLFSNVPFNSSRETYIDHIFVNKNYIGCINYCKILENSSLNVSTHRPILLSLCNIFAMDILNDEPKNIINWQN